MVSLKLIALLICSFRIVTSYIIYNVDDPHVCNQSIYLNNGPHSAAILKLTSRDSYSFSSLYCTVSFKVSIHHWSGLTGVLENVDLRTYEDNSHHLGRSFCVDYIKILSGKQVNPIPTEEQCGTWSISPGQPLSKFGYNKALAGYCPHTISNIVDNEDCHVTELKIIVSIGRKKNENLWKSQMWKARKGFTFVVTAYSYPIKNGESECRDGLRSCKHANVPGSFLGLYHCVHDSLWCDGHVNCGVYENMDEINCFRKGMWREALGPWMGISILMLLFACGIVYWKFSDIRISFARAFNREHSSFAESAEFNSNLSAAHNMAIQVRVTCNSNRQHGRGSRVQSWKNDLPPSYETLFPQGPPQASTSAVHTTITTTQNMTANIVTTLTGAVISSLGVTSFTNAGSSLSVITTEASGPVSGTASDRIPAVSSSIIDLNIINSVQVPVPQTSEGLGDSKSVSRTDATIAESQTNVLVSVSPCHGITLQTNSADNSQKNVRTENIEPEAELTSDLLLVANPNIESS